MYLIDVKVNKTTPINREISQEDWKKIYPKQTPRRVYYTFAHGKPTEVKEIEIANYLMEKFPTIRMTELEVDKVIAGLHDLSYEDLKRYGVRYGWNIVDISIKRDALTAKIKEQLINYVFPMNDKEYAEFQKKQEVIAQADKVRLDGIREKEELNKKREEELALAEQETAPVNKGKIKK